MSEPRTITAWVCDECGYWQQNEGTRKHMTGGADWRGVMMAHPLRFAVFAEIEPVEEDAKYGDFRDQGFAG